MKHSHVCQGIMSVGQRKQIVMLKAPKFKSVFRLWLSGIIKVVQPLGILRVQRAQGAQDSRLTKPTNGKKEKHNGMKGLKLKALSFSEALFYFAGRWTGIVSLGKKQSTCCARAPWFAVALPSASTTPLLGDESTAQVWCSHPARLAPDTGRACSDSSGRSGPKAAAPTVPCDPSKPKNQLHSEHLPETGSLRAR